MLSAFDAEPLHLQANAVIRSTLVEQNLNNKYQHALVTLTFLFIVPFVIGFIRVYFELKIHDVSNGRMIVLSWQPIFAFLFTTFVTLLEGSICIILALPAFMFCASLGALIGGNLVKYYKAKRSIFNSFLILPILIGPLETEFVNVSQVYTVTDTIVIDSPASTVWQQLANVDKIAPQEIEFSWTDLLGIPRPIEASMTELAEGGVRLSKWDKGIEFKEVITQWQPNKLMAYNFEIDPDAIPDMALDQHVKLGGDYFSPLHGAYILDAIDE